MPYEMGQIMSVLHITIRTFSQHMWLFHQH